MQNYYLENTLPFSDHHFAIIDRMRYPKIGETWPVYELVSPMLKPQAHLYPWILPLAEMQASDWKMLMNELEQRSSISLSPVPCLLLRSEYSLQEVRDQLIKAMYFTDEYQQGHILRYYDQRVLFHLSWMFTPVQLMKILPLRQISHWSFLIDSHWHTLSIPVSTSVSASQDFQTHALQARLQNIGLINMALEAVEAIDGISERIAFCQNVEILLVQARALGLSKGNDLLTFALSAIKYSPGFWKTSVIQSVLAQAVKVPGYFDRKINMLSDTEWQGILAQQK